VEPRSRVRLVERIEPSARPGLIAAGAAVPKPSADAPHEGPRR
jgi:hypothetical protein